MLHVELFKRSGGAIPSVGSIHTAARCEACVVPGGCEEAAGACERLACEDLQVVPFLLNIYSGIFEKAHGTTNVRT